ncbi:MAG: hypothetical protein WCK69_01055 [Candidatus Saccharibacteria bacterium]
MQQDGTIYTAKPSEYTEIVVGDEKQPEFYPRVKIKKWDNEVNLSVGLTNPIAGSTVVQEGEQITWSNSDTEARFYPISAGVKPKPTKIRRVLKNKLIQPYEASAEYEFMRHRANRLLTIIDIATYITPPMLMHFDAMPTGRYTQVEDDGHAIDYDYADKSAYHPNDMIMPKVGRIPANRIYSPYTVSANPYYADEGLVTIDIQYGYINVPGIENVWCDSIVEVLANHGIEVIRPTERTKLYFKHKGRLVKFHSAENARGVVLGYFNLNCMYNKAYDYYKPGVEQDVRDEYAYGIQTAHPEITIDVVNEIVDLFAKKLSLPIDDTEYTSDEWESIRAIIPQHKDVDWIREAKRQDANWFHTVPRDGFEFEFDVYEKPDTNIFELSITTKGLDFYRQEALTPKEIEEGSSRDPDVVGSYAVYHSESKYNNEYQTGKAFHIYRPIARDANGIAYFCDMDIDIENSIMRITVPQIFLDEATYPIIIDPTFGYGSVGASATGFGNQIMGTVQTMPEAGYVTSMSAYISTGGSTTADFYQFEFGLYDTSGNYLAQSGNTNTTANLNGWSTLNLNSAYNLPSASYVLSTWGYVFPGTYSTPSTGIMTIAYDSTVGKTSKYASSTYSADNWPSTVTFTNWSDIQLSIYATYTVPIGYKWPIMMGNAQAMAATARYMPMYGGSSTGWATSASAQSVVSPSDAWYSDFRFDLTTAPGGVTARAMSVSGNIPATITGAAVTATNTTDVVNLAAGTSLYIGNAPTGTPASSTGNKWRLAVTSTYQAWYSTSISALSTTATRFMGVQDGKGLSTTGAAATSTMPNDSGTIKNARCNIVGGTLGSGSYTITLVINGSDTSIIMALNSTTYFATDTDTVAVTNSNTLYWKIVPSVGPAPDAGVWVAISCEYESVTPGRGIVFGGVSTSVSGTTYSSSFDAWNATETLISARAVTHTIIALRADLSVAPSSTNTRTLTFRKAAVDQTPAITITSTAVSGSWSGSLAVATDDLIDFKHTSTGAPTASNLFWSYVFTAPAVAVAVTYAPRMLLMGVG